jgi:hypothetical protein
MIPLLLIWVLADNIGSSHSSGSSVSDLPGISSFALNGTAEQIYEQGITALHPAPEPFPHTLDTVRVSHLQDGTTVRLGSNRGEPAAYLEVDGGNVPVRVSVDVGDTTVFSDNLVLDVPVDAHETLGYRIASDVSSDTSVALTLTEFDVNLYIAVDTVTTSGAFEEQRRTLPWSAVDPSGQTLPTFPTLPTGSP